MAEFSYIQKELADLVGVNGVTPLALVGACLFARAAPAIWMTPVFGGALVPRTVRLGLALVFGALLFPTLAAELPRIVAGGNGLIIAVLIKEAAIGVGVAFITGLIFYGAQSAGWLADTARGANMGEVMVPQAGKRSTAMGSLLFQLSVVIFFALGAHRIFLVALAHSYETLPLGHFPSALGLKGFAMLCAKLTGGIFVAALSWAGPVIGVAVVADISLGWVNRFAPQVNSFFLAMPLKAALGVLFLSLAMGAFVLLLPEGLEAMVGHVSWGIGWLAQ